MDRIASIIMKNVSCSQAFACMLVVVVVCDSGSGAP